MLDLEGESVVTKTYIGTKTHERISVTVSGPDCDYALDARKIADDWPNSISVQCIRAFSWGDKSPGATALAYAILADHFGEGRKLDSFNCLRPFRDLVVAGWKKPVWKIDTDEIDNALFEISMRSD